MWARWLISVLKMEKNSLLLWQTFLQLSCNGKDRFKITFDKACLKLAINLDKLILLILTNYWYSHGFDPAHFMANFYFIMQINDY